MITVFLKVAMIFFMVAVGVIACKKDILPLESKQYLMNLLMKLICPCLIFSSMVEQRLDEDLIEVIQEIMVGSVIFFLIIMLMGYLLVKVLHYPQKEDEGILMALLTSQNTGFMGFPVTKAIFGDYYFFLMVVQNIIFNVYLFIFCPMQINIGHNAKFGISRIKSMINGNTIAVVAGLFFMFLKIPVPEVVFDFFNTMGAATVPLSMIILGMQLCESDISQIVKNKKMFLICTIKMAIIPLITYFILNLLPIMKDTKIILIFAAAFPCAVLPVVIAMQEGRNSKLMAEGVALTTVMSLATLPLWAIFLMYAFF